MNKQPRGIYKTYEIYMFFEMWLYNEIEAVE